VLNFVHYSLYIKKPKSFSVECSLEFELFQGDSKISKVVLEVFSLQRTMFDIELLVMLSIELSSKMLLNI